MEIEEVVYIEVEAVVEAEVEVEGSRALTALSVEHHGGPSRGDDAAGARAEDGGRGVDPARPLRDVRIHVVAELRRRADSTCTQTVPRRAAGGWHRAVARGSPRGIGT